MPRAPTLLFLTFANIVAAIMPALFIARLRAELAAAQQYQLVQAWHFRRLGSDLLHARTPG